MFNMCKTIPRMLVLAVLFVVAMEFGIRSTGLNAAFLYAQF